MLFYVVLSYSLYLSHNLSNLLYQTVSSLVYNFFLRELSLGFARILFALDGNKLRPTHLCVLKKLILRQWLVRGGVRNFTAGDGYSLLLPEVTTLLSHRGAYLLSEAATIVCGRKPQEFMTQKFWLNLGYLVTLTITAPRNTAYWKHNIISSLH